MRLVVPVLYEPAERRVGRVGGDRVQQFPPSPHHGQEGAARHRQLLEALGHPTCYNLQLRVPVTPTFVRHSWIAFVPIPTDFLEKFV